MANEVCRRQAEAVVEQPTQVSVSRYRRYCALTSCRVAERQGMPVFPSPLSGFSFHPVKRPYIDHDICTEDDSSPIKRLKIRAGLTGQGVVGRPLATVNSNFEKSSSLLPAGLESRIGRVVDDLAGKCDERYGTRESDRSTGKQEGGPEISNPRFETENWKLRIVASSRFQSPSLLASDVIGTIDFNENGDFFATGGIARRIRIFSYLDTVRDHKQVLSEEDNDEDDHDGVNSTFYRRNFRRKSSSSYIEHAPATEICTPGKLSSLKWRPDGSEVLGCGDYDGVVTEWSIEHGHTVSERYEHCGQRVWSLDYCKLVPTLSASSSADGTVRVWSREIEKSVVVLRPPNGNSICSVEFNPAAQHLMAVASADAHVYLYDLRKPQSPLMKLSGHDRAVSYVRFLGQDKLVSASIDSTLKLWDFSAPLSVLEDPSGQYGKPAELGGSTSLVRTFNSHINVKNFVGLSVHEGAGILACGSETDKVFLYKHSSSVPLLRHNFLNNCMGLGDGRRGSSNTYVSAVCWREQGDDYSLVAANSEGLVQVLQASTST